MALDRDRALRASAFAVVALVLLRAAVFTTGFASWLDSAILQGFLDLDRPRVARLSHAVASLADPLPFALLGLALIAIAIAARRLRAAIVIPVVLLGASLTTQFLKAALADARPDYGHHALAASTWPSGHSTAAMALALCAVLAVPAGRRVVTATLGGTFAVAVGFAVMTLDWHFPSDVLGGYLVALAWTLTGVAVLRSGAPVAAAERARDAATALRLVALGLVGAVLLALLAGPMEIVSYARTHTAFVLAAPTLATLGLALTAGFAATLRR